MLLLCLTSVDYPKGLIGWLGHEDEVEGDAPPLDLEGTPDRLGILLLAIVTAPRLGLPRRRHFRVEKLPAAVWEAA